MTSQVLLNPCIERVTIVDKKKILHDGESLLVQMPFGESEGMEQAFGKDYLSIMFTTGTRASQRACEFLQSLDERIVTEAEQNVQLWFGKSLDRDKLCEIFQSPWTSHDSTLKIKVPPNTPVFSAHTRLPVESSNFKKVSAIIECTGLFFSQAKFSLHWQAKQLMVDDSSPDYMFIEES